MQEKVAQFFTLPSPLFNFSTFNFQFFTLASPLLRHNPDTAALSPRPPGWIEDFVDTFFSAKQM